MDNIKDRQFYWEVKQFFNGKPENNVPAQPKPSLKDAVSGVLKENNPYKQTNFSNNQTSVNAAQNAIQGLGAMDAANKPSCVAYTKNAIKNPFNLNEGFWDIAGGVKKKIDDYTGKTERDAAEAKANSSATEQRLNAEDARKKEIYKAANDRDKAFAGRWNAVENVVQTMAGIRNLQNYGYVNRDSDQGPDPNYDKDVIMGGLVGHKSLVGGEMASGLGGLATSMKQQNASLNPVASAQTTKPPVAPSPTPVQTQTPKTASTPAPVQGQSQAPNAQTKVPVQGQPQSVPAKNQPTTTSTTPYTRQYVSSEPEGQPKRGPGGGVIAPPVPLDDRKASDMPGAYQDKRMEVTMNLPPIKNDIGIPSMKGGASLSQRTQPMASGGQYRGSSNMGMATRPNRPEAMTLQSAMAQQNQQATRNTLGQMGAVQGTSNSSSGFQGSVLPPANQLTSMGTQKENEFKYARGSRLA
jgi:hypothetical protein